MATDAKKICSRDQACSPLVPILLPLLFGFIGHPIATVAATIPTTDRVRLLANARPVQEVGLIDQDGNSFRLSQLRGQVVLVFFGITNCPDVGPSTMQRLGQLQKLDGPALNESVMH